MYHGCISAKKMIHTFTWWFCDATCWFGLVLSAAEGKRGHVIKETGESVLHKASRQGLRVSLRKGYYFFISFFFGGRGLKCNTYAHVVIWPRCECSGSHLAEDFRVFIINIRVVLAMWRDFGDGLRGQAGV